MAEMGTDPPLAAEVILRPPGGRLSGRDRITSANVAAYLPESAAVAAATDFFRDRGFEVSEPRGISFTITGPQSVFERTFGTSLAVIRQDGVTSVTGEPGTLELPLGQIPSKVRDVIEAVTFTPPPDYGPTKV
jgi:hypothetical protein